MQTRQHVFPDSVKALCVIDDGRRIAAAIADGSLVVWELRTAAIVANNTNAFLPNSVGWLPRAGCLLSVGRDLILRTWSPDLQLRQARTAHSRSIKAIAVAPNGAQWATAGYDSTICIWRDGEVIAEGLGHGWPGVPALHWLDSHTLISGGWDSTVRFWNASGESLAVVELTATEPW